LPTAQKISSLAGITARQLESPHIGRFSRHGRKRAALGCPFQQEDIDDMACLRATVLATAVGLMALATPALAEVIVTPDGHYYKRRKMPASTGEQKTGRDAVADH
jgi:hypothetical protein